MQGKQIIEHSNETAKTIRRISIAALGFLTVVVWRADPGKTYPVASPKSTTTTHFATSPSSTTAPTTSTTVPSTTQAQAPASTQAPPQTTQAPVAVSGGS